MPALGYSTPRSCMFWVVLLRHLPHVTCLAVETVHNVTTDHISSSESCLNERHDSTCWMVSVPAAT
eukprot:6574-Heterococcus_DN1.PRE.1